MGMFDEVHFQMACPTCGTVMKNFQSKDGVCELETVEPDAVNNFYCSCRKCLTWVEFRRGRQQVPAREVPLTLDEVTAIGFHMTVDQRLKKS